MRLGVRLINSFVYTITVPETNMAEFLTVMGVYRTKWLKSEDDNTFINLDHALSIVELPSPPVQDNSVGEVS